MSAGAPGEPPVVLAHLVGLAQMGGIERCYSEFVSHPTARRFAVHHTWITGKRISPGLRERVANAGGAITPARHRGGIRIPRWAGWLQKRQIERLAASTAADAVVLWSNPGWLGILPDDVKIIYYEHGAAWFKSAFERVRRHLDRPVGFIANSFAARRMLELRWEIDPGRIHVCLNAVRSDCRPESLPDRDPPRPDRVRLGAVGRMVPLKGFAVAIHAVAALRRRGVEASLDFAGDGPERDKLVALAERLAVSDHVRMRGTLSDMGAFYREIDVLVAPSLRETFGLINAEAMTHGIPVVTAAVDGVPEVVADGETGICVAPSLDIAAYEQLGGSNQGLPPLCYDPIGDRLRAPMALDPERVADAVVEILDQPDRYREMGRRGRDRVERLFDAERYTTELSTILVGLAGKQAPGIQPGIVPR